MYAEGVSHEMVFKVIEVGSCLVWHYISKVFFGSSIQWNLWVRLKQVLRIWPINKSHFWFLFSGGSKHHQGGGGLMTFSEIDSQYKYIYTVRLLLSIHIGYEPIWSDNWSYWISKSPPPPSFWLNDLPPLYTYSDVKLWSIK